MTKWRVEDSASLELVVVPTSLHSFFKPLGFREHYAKLNYSATGKILFPNHFLSSSHTYIKKLTLE